MPRLALAPLIALLMAAAAQADDQAVARIKTIEGAADVVRAGERTALVLGSPLYAKDLIETSDGSVGLTFKDGTRISLGPHSRLECRDYAFSPADERYGFLVRLLHGTMMFVSGSLPKLAPDAVHIETPVATVAVRGTAFLAKIEQD